MRVVAFLQARTDSTRLPRKVLKPILGKPMIIHQLQRVEKALKIDELILLTSTQESDNKLATIVEKSNFKVYRGSENNVLKRFYDCSHSLKLQDTDVIVRLTGDCPLHDAKIIDESIDAFLELKCDYLANCVEPIYPDGLDVEVFSVKSLHIAFKNAKLNSDKEHVTPYIRNSKEFKVNNLIKKPVYPQWRLTVDEKSDFELISKIFNYFDSSYFSFEETVKFLEEHQELLKINSTISRNEGYKKSLKEDNDN